MFLLFLRSVRLFLSCVFPPFPPFFSRLTSPYLLFFYLLFFIILLSLSHVFSLTHTSKYVFLPSPFFLPCSLPVITVFFLYSFSSCSPHLFLPNAFLCVSHFPQYSSLPFFPAFFSSAPFILLIPHTSLSIFLPPHFSLLPSPLLSASFFYFLFAFSFPTVLLVPSASSSFRFSLSQFSFSRPSCFCFLSISLLSSCFYFSSSFSLSLFAFSFLVYLVPSSSFFLFTLFSLFLPHALRASHVCFFLPLSPLIPSSGILSSTHAHTIFMRNM